MNKLITKKEIYEKRMVNLQNQHATFTVNDQAQAGANEENTFTVENMLPTLGVKL